MKHLFTVILLSLAIASPMALRADDHPHKQQKCPPDVASIVTDLTPAQKKKIEQISKDGKDRIHKLEEMHRQVRDSIRTYMDAYEDNSRKLNPLFELEAKIECDINKEKYSIKTAINRVLTPEQHKQLVDHFKKNRKHEGCDKPCDQKMEKGVRKLDKALPVSKEKKMMKEKR